MLNQLKSSDTFDAVVIGSGPNGLAAAVTLARAGWSVLVVEGHAAPGGGIRTAELTLPGFRHDVCSAVHPFGISSRFFRELPLEQHGLQWLHSPAALAHPLDEGRAVLLERSLDDTALHFGPDGKAYKKLFGPLVSDWSRLQDDILAAPRLPSSPFSFLRFGIQGLRTAASTARSRFKSEAVRTLFAGLAAHSIIPLDMTMSAAIAIVLGCAAHAQGWPFPKGGSGALAGALISYLKSIGGLVVAGSPVNSIDELPKCKVILFDTSPEAALRLAAGALPPSYAKALRLFKRGPGVFKLDWALSGPIPWRASGCMKAATIHLGGSLSEIAESERAAWDGAIAPRPFVLLVQPSLFDDSRAPAGKHTAWAYCHVPNGSLEDMTSRIEAQIERFAPGFKDLILARSAISPAALEADNPNIIGGDIAGGANTMRQIFARPVWSLKPHRLVRRKFYLCSSSTPPGAGVHGMCGYWAAQTVIADWKR